MFTVAPAAPTSTTCSVSFARSCHTFTRYRPAGTPSIRNEPFGAVTAKYG